MSTQEQPATKDNWKLALFSEPTNRENLPIKVFEALALCFCVVHVFVLLWITYSYRRSFAPHSRFCFNRTTCANRPGVRFDWSVGNRS